MSVSSKLEQAMAGLTPLERQVLILTAGDGLRNAEIGTRLVIGERRAERILARALRKLDRALDERPRRWWRW